MLPPGWEVRKQFRDEYWVAHKMHGEFAALSRANNLPLPKEFTIMFDGELVGWGDMGAKTYTTAQWSTPSFVKRNGKCAALARSR